MSQRDAMIRILKQLFIIAILGLPTIGVHAAVVNGVQSGVTTSTANGVRTVAITAVDPGKSFLIFNVSSADNEPVDSLVRGRLNGAGTQLEFERVTNAFGIINVITIQWYLVEYTSGVSVQRGEVSQTSTSVNVPISAVSSTSQAFVLHSKTYRDSDNNWDQRAPIVAELTSTTNVQIRSNTADSNHIVSWQVIEYTDPADIEVQKGSTSLTGGNASVNVILPTVIDTDATFLLSSFRSSSSGSDLGERMIRGQITSTNSIRFDRDDTGDNLTEIFWQVVHLKDGTSVQSGSEGFANLDQVETVVINPIDVGRSVAFASVQAGGGQTMGKTEYSFNDVLGAGTFNLSLTSNLLTIARGYNRDTADVGWFVVQFNNTPSTVLPGAVAEWRFDEASWDGTANEVEDNSGNALHGTTVSGASTTDGKVCNGADFDGVDDYIEIADDPLLDFTDAFTVMAWVKPEGLSVASLNSILSKDTNYEFHIDTLGNVFWWWQNSAGLTRAITTTGITLGVGTWAHVAIVYSSAGSQKVYINGVERGSATFAETLMTNNLPLQIGGDQGYLGREYNGVIDEVRIYDTPFTVDQVNTAMLETRNCITVPFAYYDMENIVGGTVVDQSGQGNDGTAVNGMSNDAATPAVSSDPGTCDYGTFDGVNDYIGIPSLPDLTGGLTFTAWIRPDRINGDQRIFADDENNTGGYAFSLGDGGNGRLRFFSRNINPVSIDSAAVITADTWWFVAAVHNEETRTQSIYASSGLGDPVLVAQGTYLGVWGTDSGLASIGGETNGAGGEAVPQWRFDGDIDEVRVYDFPLTGAELADVKRLTHPCGFGPDHFTISHDNFGINCLGESMTVTAVDAGGTAVPTYTGTITLDTQNGNGSWSLSSGNGAFSDTTAGDGLASYTFDTSDGGSASFTLDYPQGPESVNVDVFEGSVRDDDTEGDILFSPNGFTVTAAALSNPPPASIDTTIPSQVAATDFTLYVAAYGQTPSDATCGIIEAYDGARDVNVWANYSNPATGTLDMSVNGSGIATDITASAEAASTSQAITFANGQASITVNYPDAGEMELGLKDISGGHPDLPNGIRGSSEPFVVKPADFMISNVIRTSDSVANPGTAVDQNGDVFIAAGEAFTATVTAVNSLGNPTPNYGQEVSAESVVLSSSLVAAGFTDNPAIQYPSGIGLFANGAVTLTDLFWNEVGIIQLSAEVADGDYLGAGNVVGTASDNIGRFVPADFTVSTNSPSFATQCGTFTYYGQNFPYNVAPITTITAVAADGFTRTDNYNNTWWKLPDFSETYGHDGTPPTGVTLDASAAGHAALVCSNCQGSSSVNFSGSFQYDAATPETPPTTGAVNVGFSLLDDDGVAFSGNPYTIGPIGFNSGSEIRSGRGYAPDVHGTYANNGDALPMPVGMHYYQNSTNGWVPNTADNCTTLSYTKTDNGITTTVTPGSPLTMTNGVVDLALQMSGDAGDPGGSATINFNWPSWITGVPSATATFGVFRGDDRYIFWREGP